MLKEKSMKFFSSFFLLFFCMHSIPLLFTHSSIHFFSATVYFFLFIFFSSQRPIFLLNLLFIAFFLPISLFYFFLSLQHKRENHLSLFTLFPACCKKPYKNVLHYVPFSHTKFWIKKNVLVFLFVCASRIIIQSGTYTCLPPVFLLRYHHHTTNRPT